MEKTRLSLIKNKVRGRLRLDKAYSYKRLKHHQQIRNKDFKIQY